MSRERQEETEFGFRFLGHIPGATSVGSSSVISLHEVEPISILLGSKFDNENKDENNRSSGFGASLGLSLCPELATRDQETESSCASPDTPTTATSSESPASEATVDFDGDGLPRIRHSKKGSNPVQWHHFQGLDPELEQQNLDEIFLYGLGLPLPTISTASDPSSTLSIPDSGTYLDGMYHPCVSSSTSTIPTTTSPFDLEFTPNWLHHNFGGLGSSLTLNRISGDSIMNANQSTYTGSNVENAFHDGDRTNVAANALIDIGASMSVSLVPSLDEVFNGLSQHDALASRPTQQFISPVDSALRHASNPDTRDAAYWNHTHSGPNAFSTIRAPSRSSSVYSNAPYSGPQDFGNGTPHSRPPSSSSSYDHPGSSANVGAQLRRNSGSATVTANEYTGYSSPFTTAPHPSTYANYESQTSRSESGSRPSTATSHASGSTSDSRGDFDRAYFSSRSHFPNPHLHSHSQTAQTSTSSQTSSPDITQGSVLGYVPGPGRGTRNMQGDAEADVGLDLRAGVGYEIQRQGQGQQNQDYLGRRSGARPLTRSAPRKKTHQCIVCFKSFDRPSTLRKHHLVHTGEKSHACGLCGRRFGVASNLNRHMRRCALTRRVAISESMSGPGPEVNPVTTMPVTPILSSVSSLHQHHHQHQNQNQAQAQAQHLRLHHSHLRSIPYSQSHSHPHSHSQLHAHSQSTDNWGLDLDLGVGLGMGAGSQDVVSDLTLSGGMGVLH